VFLLTIGDRRERERERLFYEGRKACWIFEITYFEIFTWLSIFSLSSVWSFSPLVECAVTFRTVI
jgi:hypothetical protein